MPARDDLQHIAITNFSPGIFDDWFGAGGATGGAPGAARLTGTFGCCASRNGSLIPAPRKVNTILASPPDDLDASHDGTERIMAFRCMSPMWDRTGVGAFESGQINPHPDMLAICFEAYLADSGPFKHFSRFRVYKMFRESSSNPALDAVPTFDVATHDAGSFSSRLKYGWSGVDLSRDNYTDPTIVGYPIAAFVFTSNKDVREYERLAYPDSAAPATDGSTSMDGLDQPGGFAAYGIFAHQDRLLALDRSANISMGTAGEVPTDLIVGTTPNGVKTQGVPLVAFVSENPGLYGAWATVNASEALFIKQQRGGFVVRGDVDFPTIVRLPGLPPTYEAINIACAAQDGKVYYGSTNGVFAWSGGDTAELVSRQLNGWFWKPGALTDDVLHCKGSFSAVDRFLFAPNDFFYDIEQKGWWRLSDGDDDDFLPHAWWDVSAAGQAIGVPNYLSDTQHVLADYYDIYQGQSTYTFTSQPMMAAKNRVTHFRYLDVKLQGHGDVAITLFGRDTEMTVNVQVDSDEPVLFNKALAAHCYDPYYKIVATAFNDDQPAPEIISLDFSHGVGATADHQ